MKRKQILFAVAFMVMVLALGSAYAAETVKQKDANREKAKAMVKEAVAFVKANGKEKAIAELNKPEGQFVKGEFYVFAYDLTGTVIAHPKRPELIGKNMINEPDSQGKLFRKEIVTKAQSKGKGWVKYMYVNPTSKKEELKSTYFRKENDMIICCGAY